MKPTWDTAPEWANYLAQDSDGYFWWYEKRPEVDELLWYTNGKTKSAILPSDGRWHDTLEERPK